MAEIRMREVSKALTDKLAIICRDLGEATASGGLEKLINTYHQDKAYKEQLIKRSNELHNSIAKYVQREAEMKNLIEVFIKNTDKFNKMVTTEAATVLRKFMGPKKKKKPAGKLFAK